MPSIVTPADLLLDPGPPMVDNFALYFFFVEKNGYWVVDEAICVGPARCKADAFDQYNKSPR